MSIQTEKFDWGLFLLFALVFPFAILFSLNYPNVVLEQGLSHKIFYLHVSVAWVALYAPVFSAIFGIFYLIKKNDMYDFLSVSSAKIAFLFSIAVIFSGRIWAKSAWGVFWDWTDARLQSFTVLFFSLSAYLLLRSMITEKIKRKIFSSFLSILTALNSVITWGAIRWIENPGNHPGSVLSKGGMESDMKIAFWLNIIAYHLFFLILFIIIYRNEKLNDTIDYLKEINS
ncbi:MAG: cytochrome c biogenesis protein [Leptospiraceae bacterium]|nr:cytochrome c biogenesis protein CcsA [Leptospiraceae bacterium]MCK6380504.1 cytochrome c biogenesis protein [Leptospiraceae bacterium]